MLQVLVADDDPAILSLWARVLRATFGADVVLARDGSSAKARLADARPDLLVVDYRMPGCTGLDVVRHARALDPGVPAVLVTGDPAAFVELQAERLCVSFLLEKPFRRDDARRAVTLALARGAPSLTAR